VNRCAAPPVRNEDAVRTWNALRAHLRQELLAPVAALVDYSAMLQEEAERRGYESVQDDIRVLHDCCVNLQSAVNRILAPSNEAEAQHSLRNPLNPIVQYCEMLLEDAANALLPEGFIPDLREMRDIARFLVGRIAELFAFRRQASLAGPSADVGFPDGHLPPRLSARALPPAETGTILVVDDNPFDRKVLLRRLQRDGHQVAVAADGRSALERVQEMSFDLILLDILMPGLSGFETLAELKSDDRYRHIPVIMISALDEVDSTVRCIELGAEDYLTKPCNQVLLRARIGACLEKKRLRDREVQHLAEISQAKERVDELLHVILPPQVVPELVATGTVQPRHVHDVAVLFADIVNFTPYCGQNPPDQVVRRLQWLVEAWEELAVLHGVLKIKTIGDAFMAACGLLGTPKDDPVLCCLRFGEQMIAAAQRLTPGWQVRAGVHVGSVVAGVVGRRQYQFDLWGDTVNIAARMESHGRPGTVNLSSEAWARVADYCHGQPNPGMVKGIGRADMVIFGGFKPHPTILARTPAVAPESHRIQCPA